MSRFLTLHDPDNAQRFYAEGHWRPETFYALLQHNAECTPDACFLRDSYRRLTYAEALAWVEILAARFAAAGLHRGERVAISAPNRVEVPLVFLACSRNGYACNPSLHQNYTTREVLQLIERIGARALVALPGYGVDGAIHDRADAAEALGGLRRVFRLGHGADAGELSPDAGEGAPPPPLLSPDKVVYLAFTSGTTGTPKAVMHSDNTLLANARPMVADWGHDAGTVLFSMSPLSHHNGWVALGQVLVCGGELVVNDLPSSRGVLDRIVAVGATYLMGVPTHAIDLIAEARARGAERIGRVRTWYVAGATIPPDVSRSIVSLGARPQNVYGMTENSSHQYPLPNDSFEVMTTTCGRANAGYEVAIFDPENTDRMLGPGETGEIGGRGACLMLGYFDNQGATEKSFNSDGWFLTGDLGRLDADNCLSIVGRSKDVIIRGGHNIYPGHIENLSVTHPLIEKAAAFAVTDPRLGEKVCLAVTLSESAALSPDQILEHLHTKGLSRYDMPEYVLPLEVMPTTASGKILKRELSELVRAGSVTPTPVRFQAAV
ncbi:class I adenylate-forming enzyme family protein [Xanthobacter autotrophicus DSM 431]|uniref:class I adenylate-forming enzyme family protein n=1 Tax=Xanthobacter nonsaccharivorans TaxID=3119912 RepID=UPI00372C798E